MGAPRVIRVRLELVGSLEMPVGSGWWLSFTCDLGICTSVTAGIRLSLAWDEGYRLWFVRRMLKLESEFFSMARIVDLYCGGIGSVSFITPGKSCADSIAV